MRGSGSYRKEELETLASFFRFKVREIKKKQQ